MLLGLGNLLLGDEGLGVHVVRRLATGYHCEPPITLIDGGTAGLELLPLFRDHARILMIDALDSDRPPGTVSLIRDQDIRRAIEVKLTLHHLGLAEVLALLELLDERPAELVLIGVAPQRLALDLELSPGITAAIPAVIAAVQAVLTGWGVRLTVPSRTAMSAAGAATETTEAKESNAMNDNDNFTCLRRSPLSDGLTDEQLRALTGITYCRRLQDDEVLIEEGKVDNSLHVITEGALAVTRNLGRGDYTTIHVLRTGDMAGEMGFVTGRPHSATLRSLGCTQVCSFERAAFEDLVTAEPWMIYRVMQNIVQVGHGILRRMNAEYVELTKYISHSHGIY